MTEHARNTMLCACVATCLAATLPAPARGDDAATMSLAAELAAEADHAAAAIECRRLALAEADGTRRSGYYWAAAYQYHLAHSPVIAQKMLDRVEDESDSLTPEALLLRAEVSLAADQPEQAEFYLNSLIKHSPGGLHNALADRRLAKARLLKNDAAGAEHALGRPGHEQQLQAVTAYRNKAGRSPAVGGILGLIPGLGYVYSGEYSNALRSLILNGLFIYAMADTADNEQWGAFTAVAFFELTWYTGSIYGGIDAAHRYNRNLLEDCLEAVDGNSGFTPDPKQIPVISLTFKF